MSANKPTHLSVMLARLALPLLFAYGPLAYAQTTPSQMPLLTKAGAAVAPNVMLTMDDSGSMQFQHMPENVFASDTYATTNPVLSRTVRWDKNDNYMVAVNFLGTVPGIITSNNYRLRALRAAETNTIFYNPDNLYSPWLRSDGVTRLPDSPPGAAYKNPMVRTGAAGTVINLTSKSAIGTYNAGSFVVGQTYTILVKGTTDFIAIGAADNNVNTTFVATGVGSGTGRAGGALTGWCFANANNADCANAAGNFLHDPGVYFRLKKTGTAYQDLTDPANYTAYSINGATSFPKTVARTDCSGLVGPSGCTQAEEQQNFANWFTYYRNRNLLARGSLMEAFGIETAPVAAGTFVIGSSYVIVDPGTTPFNSIGASSNAVDTVFTATGVGTGSGTARAIAMRLGFGRINKTSANVDGANTTVIESGAAYGGGGVRDFSFARKTNLFKWLEDLPASGGTPLVEAMQAVGDYYSRTSTQSPWTDNPAVTTNTVANNKTCRRSYQIMMTDGYWGGTVAVGNQDNTNGAVIASVGGATYQYVATAPYKDSWSNTLADVAMKYWKTDLQSSTNNAVPAVAENTSFWQNMTNFTVGLGVRGTLDPEKDLPALTAGTKIWPKAEAGATDPNVDDLWHAAINSRGQYFSAKDPQGLSLAIRTALAGATGGSGSTAGVATASSVLTGGNRKYVPGFVSGTWEGDILAFPLDAVGQTTASVWKASDKMPVWSSRNVVTFDASAGVWAGIPFDWDSLSASSQTAMGTVATTHTSKFIDFLKGDHSLEGAGKPFRTRINLKGVPFILGDIVNANPVLIKGNFNGSYIDPAFGGAGAYPAFMAAKRARTAVLFAGSNDGMLHAFRDSAGVTPSTDGTEIFAYVPRAVYSNLSKLADKNYGTTSTLPHQYFVDGPLHEADAYVDAPGATASPTWRNYLFGSLGAGGRAVYALDVTNPNALDASSVRWELSSADHADLGHVMSPIKVGVLPDGKWVAIFGNGYGSTGFSSTSGNAVLFIVDIQAAASSDASVRSGAVKKLTLDGTGNNGLGGVTVVPDIVTGRTQYIYVGDLKGKLWKLVYDSSAASGFSVHGGAALFAAADSTGTAQPITGTPAVFNHSSGGQMVVFGTGKLFSTSDASNVSPQSMYSVWDKSPDTITRPLARANLAARTLTSVAGTGGALGSTFYSSTGAAVNYSGSERGWFMDLNTAIPGGRVIYPSQVISYNTALISSVAPVQGTPLACESGSGMAVNIVAPVESGTNAPGVTFDTNGDGLVNSSDGGTIGYGAKADGVDAVVTSGSVSSGGTETTTAGIGGGGSENECTGTQCKKGKKCVYDVSCGPGKCLASIQNSTTGVKTCYDPGTDQRVWRRIINPPIR